MGKATCSRRSPRWRAGSRHGERLHAVITDSARPVAENLVRGCQGHAKDGKAVRFFRSAEKFKDRYATFGFNDAANLDEGAMASTSSR